MDETWTIAELAERATAALAGLAPANGRVSDVPNERLIRYYTTIGLLDPPLARRGRIALYGRRHLLQLVAVRRRQAQGLSNAAIQRDLLGATDDRLAELAGGELPASAPIGRREPEASRNGLTLATEPGVAEPRPRFWTSTPTSATPSTPDSTSSPIAPSSADTRTPPGMPTATTAPAPAATSKTLDAPPPAPVSTSAHRAFPPVFHGVSLTPEAALLLSRPLDDHELAAVTRAAQPLIDLLTDLGFTEGIPS
uniref:helix-turn-helix domain-containing protein n=1 Tax=Herbidospora sakaeratensis TaxID=564415 RepID=UPI0007C7B340|nr:helix-turn-helix domain-containing protein [Herbidospora sakaeratensis]